MSQDFRSKLEQKINENLTKRAEELVSCLRKREYIGTCGAIQALRGVLALCEEVDKELNS